MNKNSIKDFIQLYRIVKAKSFFYKGLIKTFIWSITFIILTTIFESFLYFSSSSRTLIAYYFSILFSTSIFYLLLRRLLHSKNIFNNSSDYYLAKQYSIRDQHIGDRLINALQLENNLNKILRGKDLAEAAINRLSKELKNIPLSKLFDPITNSLKSYLLISLSLLLLISFIDTSSSAILRLLKPKKEFLVPLPFSLSSINGNVKVLGGDTLTVTFGGIGELPDSIYLYWETKTDSGKHMIAENDEYYSYTFNSIKQNTKYWVNYDSPYFFSAWKNIQTEFDTIFVSDRPIIKEINFNIYPPQYTQEAMFKHPGNISTISLPKGSRVNLIGTSSKELEKVWIILDEKNIALNSLNKMINGTFNINKNQKLALHIQDKNQVTNLNPLNFIFSIIPDYAPDLIVQKPKPKFELDESNMIGFDIQISDDYGFSEAWIEYKIKAPDYLKQDSSIYKEKITGLDTSVKSQQIYFEWDISAFSLAPEDELHIQICIADNNSLSGPSITKSAILIGRYPSIEDLFGKMEEEEAEVQEYEQEIKMNLEDVHELVEELELELLKSEDVSWEQTQKTEEALEKMEEVFDQIENIKETMQKIQDQAEKNNLVSENLIEKFSEFQELLDEIMTPEMMEAMEKLQSAMEEMDPQKMLDALEDFEFDAEAFEEQLDRFIEMFELALAEQKMDEVVKRLEKMVEEQNAIMEELSNNEDMSNLASRERRQEENFKALEKTIKEASESISEFSPDASEDLKNLNISELKQSISNDLNKTRKELQNQNQSSSSKSGQSAADGLNEMLNIAQEIQSNFQEDTVDEMLRKFLALIRNLLFISQQQENLLDEIEGLRSRSPKLIEIAILQDRILRENQQFIVQLEALSRETFHISPQIASAIGKTKNAMDRTISRLEQKEISSAKKDMNTILSGLNEIANLLLESANQMQMSGSGSGMAEFMEQMEQMGQKQEGINQGTMNLSQMGMMAQQQMMEQLQQQQEELKQQLEELLNQNPDQKSSGAGQAQEEMEEVINDFRRKQIDRETHERQQRILSRMLDSQKSLTQKDYSEKRKSSTGEQLMYSGPSGLPEDMGERETLIMNAMESALQEGHSKEYQDMMKKYFRRLQKISK